MLLLIYIKWLKEFNGKMTKMRIPTCFLLKLDYYHFKHFLWETNSSLYLHTLLNLRRARYTVRKNSSWWFMYFHLLLLNVENRFISSGHEYSTSSLNIQRLSGFRRKSFCDIIILSNIHWELKSKVLQTDFQVYRKNHHKLTIMLFGLLSLIVIPIIRNV